MSNPAKPDYSDFPFTGSPTTLTVGDENGTCHLVAETLSAYLDEELDMNDRRFVEIHLNNCPMCAAELDALRLTDTRIQQEWRDNAPLPSSSEMRRSVDSIMACLPTVPAAAPAFAPRRVHAKARWMRFSTGIAGLVAFLGLLWSSYCLGYAHGRQSLRPVTMPNPNPQPVANPSPSLTPRPFSTSRFRSPLPCLSYFHASRFRPMTTQFS